MVSKRTNASIPVTPAPSLLPLGDSNLSWARFQTFCLDLIKSLPGVRVAHSYGTAGSRQKGIDIFADLKNGSVWAFQCRQWKKFTASHSRKAIQETTYEADKFFFLLSCPIDSSVRDVCRQNDKWDAWDIEDISSEVRRLPIATALPMIINHFGIQWSTSGQRSGRSDRPFPQDVELSKKARKFARKFAIGTATNRFYQRVRQYADDEISNRALQIEETA